MKPVYLFLAASLSTQAQAMTLPDSPVHPYECQACESLSHDPLSSSWRIQGDSVAQTIKPQVRESRKYRIVTTLAQLRRGIALPTRAAGAVISISPLSNTEAQSRPDFRIQKNQSQYSIKETASDLALQQALADSEFTSQNLALFQLKPELGAGRFLLTAQQPDGKPDDRYVVQVLDQGSDTYLQVTTDKSHYQYGEELTITFRLHDSAYGYPIDEITATLVGPEGDTQPLTLKRERWDTYVAHTQIKNEKNPAGKNWYIEADVSTMLADSEVVRHVHSAISYSIPSAAITEINTQKNSSQHFTATINVATASRYSLQAVFLATNKHGKREAVETVHSAAWLNPGKSQISFSLSPEIANSYKPPYYLASITLVDYGQIKPVYEYNMPTDISKIR